MLEFQTHQTQHDFRGKGLYATGCFSCVQTCIWVIVNTTDSISAKWRTLMHVKSGIEVDPNSNGRFALDVGCQNFRSTKHNTIFAERFCARQGVSNASKLVFGSLWTPKIVNPLYKAHSCMWNQSSNSTLFWMADLHWILDARISGAPNTTRFLRKGFVHYRVFLMRPYWYLGRC